MTTALATLEFNTGIANAAEMTVIHEIVSQCEDEIALMNRVNDFMSQGNTMRMINRLQELNRSPDAERTRFGYEPAIKNVSLQFVKENIWAEYWQKVTDMTNVLRVMPAQRREEWREQFIHGKQKRIVKTKWDEREALTYVGVPEFNAATVIPTMSALLNDRYKYLAERVYGVFKALSPNHKTNKHYGFSEKLIISNCITDYWNSSVSVNYNKVDYIEDLRVLLHFFAHKEFTTFSHTSSMFGSVYKQNEEQCGIWTNVDGNLLRLKMFKNGNVHFEIHPDVAWKLNEVLASMMPAAIPSSVRKAPKTKAPKEFGYIQKVIKSCIRSSLRDGRYSTEHDAWLFTDGVMQKSDIAERDRILTILGGVKARGWRFPYKADEAINEIVVRGLLPETKSHQFYPTPEKIAKYAAELVGDDPSLNILEPSAGTGSLLTYLTQDKGRIDCVEVADLFTKVLAVKGYNAIKADFLKWAESNRFRNYDRILMNPPYSEGRAKEHTVAALELLAPEGEIIAVLPAGYKPAEWIGAEFSCVKSDTQFDNEFDETGISVAVFTITRK